MTGRDRAPARDMAVSPAQNIDPVIDVGRDGRRIEQRMHQFKCLPLVRVDQIPAQGELDQPGRYSGI